MPWYNRPEGFTPKSFDTYADKRPEPDCVPPKREWGPRTHSDGAVFSASDATHNDYENYVLDPSEDDPTMPESLCVLCMTPVHDTHPFRGGFAHGVCIVTLRDERDAYPELDLADPANDPHPATHPEWLDEGGSE